MNTWFTLRHNKATITLGSSDSVVKALGVECGSLFTIFHPVVTVLLKYLDPTIDANLVFVLKLSSWILKLSKDTPAMHTANFQPISR